MFIETQHVNQKNLPDLLVTLQDCWKSSSLLWLQANGFPVLPGLILNGWEPKAEEAVARFCRERNFSELLVRIEKPGQRWTQRRGGYTIPVSGVQDLVRGLSREGMLTLLLEPASPYSDLYGLTSVSDLETGRIDLEVVGPGFDASDVLRADNTPHERYEIEVETGPNRFRKPQPSQINRKFVVSPDTYRASVQRRLAKIGARLRNPSFPDEELQATESDSNSGLLAQEAKRYLQESGHDLLLRHLTEYEPVSPKFLELFLTQLMRVLRAAAEAHVSWKAISMAASFLGTEGPVIWDFFPTGDHDTLALVTMRAAPLSQS